MKYVWSSFYINLEPENPKLRPKMDKNQEEIKQELTELRK